MRHIYDFMIEKDQPLEKDHPLGFCVVDFFHDTAPAEVTRNIQEKSQLNHDSSGCINFTISVRPNSFAQHNGVRPSVSTQLTSAFASIRVVTIPMFSNSTAKDNGVRPSICAKLASAFAPM